MPQPTPAMRDAMARAEAGDDVFGDDSTMARLEARVTKILGKEASVFTPSGTMANQVALRAHTEPGDEMLIAGNAHIYYYESARQPHRPRDGGRYERNHRDKLYGFIE